MGASERRCLTCQPSSRTGENPPHGMIRGTVETSASFEARYAPLSYPTAGGDQRWSSLPRQLSKNGDREDVNSIDLLRPRFPHRDFWLVSRNSHRHVLQLERRRDYWGRFRRRRRSWKRGSARRASQSQATARWVVGVSLASTALLSQARARSFWPACA